VFLLLCSCRSGATFVVLTRGKKKKFFCFVFVLCFSFSFSRSLSLSLLFFITEVGGGGGLTLLSSCSFSTTATKEKKKDEKKNEKMICLTFFQPLVIFVVLALAALAPSSNGQPCNLALDNQCDNAKKVSSNGAEGLYARLFACFVRR
jgi:hypothetical protein